MKDEVEKHAQEISSIKNELEKAIVSRKRERELALRKQQRKTRRLHVWKNKNLICNEI